MKENTKTYMVEFVRAAGIDPLTGEYMPRTDQKVEVDSYSIQGAVATAKHLCSIEPNGQKRRIFVNDKEFIDPTF